METERIGGEREGDFTDNSIGCPKFKPVLWGYENWHKPSTGYEAVLYPHNLCSQKIRELVLVLRANSHKFSTSKTKWNTLSQTTCSLLKHCQICKNDFWEKIHHISTQFLFLGGGGGQLSISVLQFGQFCTNVSPINNAKSFFLRWSLMTLDTTSEKWE
jgi:hypothetical protein